MGKLSRRNFIQKSTAGMVGATVASSLLGCGAFINKTVTMDKSKINKTEKRRKNLIIGTGYGSAVTALRLGEAGQPCTMLEMGMDWDKSGMKFSGMIWAEKQSTWLRNKTIAPFGNYRILKKFTGALDRMDFDNVKVYAGRGVGGGSLVNGGISVTPKKEFFKEVFPDLDADLFYDKYFPLANKELGAHYIPEDFYQNSEYYQFSRKGEEEARKAGYKTIKVPNIYDFDYMQKEAKGEVPKSALADEVIYGNNHGKKDLTKTYIKRALATGNVEILAMHKVESIEELADGGFALYVSIINTEGETIEVKYFECDKLFLGAGSLGTTKLLLKSKAEGGLLNISDEIGKYWGNNGNVMTGRNFIGGGTGSKQSTIPVAGIDNWNNEKLPFFAEIAPLPIGMEVWAGLYLVINKLKKYGAFTYNSKTDKLELEWDKRHNQHMKETTKAFIDQMNKANGGTIAYLLFNKGIGTDICYHPLGGCVLNKATDGYGRVKGTKNLYVTDGALIPGIVGVNPYVTITALAEYCIENILKEDFS